MSGTSRSPSHHHIANTPPVLEFEREGQDNSLLQNWLRRVSEYSDPVDRRGGRLQFWGAGERSCRIHVVCDTIP